MEIMKIKKTFLLIMICVLIIYSVSSASELLLSYTTVQQEKSMWCWAASAENAIRYFYSSPSHHREAVRFIKGNGVSYPNFPGEAVDSALAAEYLCGNTKNYTYTPCSLTNGVKTYSFLVNNTVNAGYPPIIIGGYYNSSNIRTGGHCVTMVGYYYSSSVKKIKYIDPMNNTLVECTYSAFKDGSANGRKYDTTVWKY